MNGEGFAAFHAAVHASARSQLPAVVYPDRVRARPVSRSFEAAQHKDSTYTWRTPTNSADAEIRAALTQLRGRSRALERDSPYANRAKAIIEQNVVHVGIGMAPQVRGTRLEESGTGLGKLRRGLNDAIADAFDYWSEAECCHMGGELHFADLENQAIGQVVIAGEVFIRMHTKQTGRCPIPLSLELIESERCPHDLLPQSFGIGAPQLRMGIEHDEYFRPLRYWFRRGHPGEPALFRTRMASEDLFAVPAAEIIHLRLIKRWPQVRGVPWLHTVADTLNNMRGYSESEITSARGAAMYLAQLIRSEWGAAPGSSEEMELEETGVRSQTMDPGAILTPAPGEKLEFFSPNRPNAALDPFLRHMLRQVAAGIGVSYESLSRDYSQSNYSSSRLALLDDRDLWRVLQMWFIRQFRQRLHREWLMRAILAKAIVGASIDEYAYDPRKYEAVKWKPRGWTWIDPQKEVAAAKEAIRGGLGTRTQTIAAIGGGIDIDDMDEERHNELERQAELGLEFDTDPGRGPDDPEQKLAADGEKARAEEDAAAAAPGSESEPAQQQRMRVVR